MPMSAPRVRIACIVLAATVPGCLTLRKDHDALAARVAELERAQAEQARTLKVTLDKADELSRILEEKVAEAEALLRRNQADLGMRVEELEVAVETLRGLVENAEYVAQAGGQELAELRRDLDVRLTKLEEKLNEATNIPEGKEALWAEALRREQSGRHQAARKLWRIYVSRYPNDPKVAEAKFHVGLTYFSERDYRAALGEFYQIIQQHPDAPILVDALYYSGLGFARLGQCANAIAYFKAIERPKVGAPDKVKEAARKQIRRLEADDGTICADKDEKSAGAAGKLGAESAASTAASKGRRTPKRRK